MTIRPARAEDLTELVQLWNASAPFDPLSPAVLEEKIWGDGDYREESCLVLESEGQLAGLGVGIRRDDRPGYIKLLAVRPEHRRRGWGGRLLARLESELVQQGAKTVRVWESHPNYLQPGQDVRYTEGILFLAKHGYQKVGETYNLTCDLAQDFEEEPHPTLQIRRASSADLDLALRFVDEVFPAWHAEVVAMFANRPISLHMGMMKEKVVGFAGYDGNNRGTGWFGPMGTHPDHRGSGLGRLLLRLCLRDMAAQGHQRAIIPWVGPYGFYARHCNARIDRVFWRYEKGLVRQEQPEPDMDCR